MGGLSLEVRAEEEAAAGVGEQRSRVGASGVVDTTPVRERAPVMKRTPSARTLPAGMLEAADSGEEDGKGEAAPASAEAVVIVENASQAVFNLSRLNSVDGRLATLLALGRGHTRLNGCCGWMGDVVPVTMHVLGKDDVPNRATRLRHKDALLELATNSGRVYGKSSGHVDLYAGKLDTAFGEVGTRLGATILVDEYGTITVGSQGPGSYTVPTALSFFVSQYGNSLSPVTSLGLRLMARINAANTGGSLTEGMLAEANLMDVIGPHVFNSTADRDGALLLEYKTVGEGKDARHVIALNSGGKEYDVTRFINFYNARIAPEQSAKGAPESGEAFIQSALGVLGLARSTQFMIDDGLDNHSKNIKWDLDHPGIPKVRFKEPGMDRLLKYLGESAIALRAAAITALPSAERYFQIIGELPMDGDDGVGASAAAVRLDMDAAAADDHRGEEATGGGASHERKD
jgi:hypothetical protein